LVLCAGFQRSFGHVSMDSSGRGGRELNGRKPLLFAGWRRARPARVRIERRRANWQMLCRSNGKKKKNERKLLQTWREGAARAPDIGLDARITAPIHNMGRCDGAGGTFSPRAKIFEKGRRHWWGDDSSFVPPGAGADWNSGPVKCASNWQPETPGWNAKKTAEGLPGTQGGTNPPAR